MRKKTTKKNSKEKEVIKEKKINNDKEKEVELIEESEEIYGIVGGEDEEE